MGATHLPARVEETFLEAIASTGSVAAAARATGTHRNTWYQRARRDPAFRAMWEDALAVRRDAIREELVGKAMAATGQVVEEALVDPGTGEAVLDDDFERVTVRRLIDYDGQVLKTMLNKFVRSEDGPSAASVQVNNLLSVEAPPRPRLVRPDGAQTIDAECEEVIDEEDG